MDIVNTKCNIKDGCTINLMVRNLISTVVNVGSLVKLISYTGSVHYFRIVENRPLSKDCKYILDGLMFGITSNSIYYMTAKEVTSSDTILEKKLDLEEISKLPVELVTDADVINFYEDAN